MGRRSEAFAHDHAPRSATSAAGTGQAVSERPPPSRLPAATALAADLLLPACHASRGQLATIAVTSAAAKIGLL